MKFSAYTTALLGFSVAIAATPLLARTIVEVGSEYEEYYNATDETGKEHKYASLTNYVPYIRFSHSPNSNEWNIWGRYFSKEYINKDLFSNGIVTAMDKRYELHYTQTNRVGDWRFRPGVGVRYNGYAIDRYEVEYRLYPQVEYFFDSKNLIFLNGHAYLGDGRGKRSGDTVAQDYTDWGYEIDVGLLHRFNAFSSIRPSFYTEYDEFQNSYDVDYWQFRLVYSHKIGRVTINPFMRLGLGRTVTERSHFDYQRWGVEMDKNYSRAGVYGNVGISGKWNVIYETYYQIEDNEYYTNGTIEPLPDRNKFFAKLGVQYIF
ncbi:MULTISPECIES: hypothetical protein [Vibrio]|uniref:hypothetical protein n=1 Tax=Vibrio TaxID=662 RepID=UPI003D0C3219